VRQLSVLTSLFFLPRLHASITTYILNLVLVERRYLIDDHPRQTPPKVHQFVHGEAHNPCRQHIIANVRIPGRPHALEDVEADVKFGDFGVFVPVGVLGVREHGIRYGVVGVVVAVVQGAVSSGILNGSRQEANLGDSQVLVHGEGKRGHVREVGIFEGA
jgi:hypothetical protein